MLLRSRARRRARLLIPATLAAAVLPASLHAVPAGAAVRVTPGSDPPAGIPSARPERYQIQAGDTLSLISRRLYGSAAWWPQLWLQNRPGDPRSLAVGTWLSIGGKWRHQPQVPARFRPKPAPVTALPPTAPARPAVPQPSPVPAGVLSYGQLEQLWASAGGPAGAEAQAASIAECESGGNPRAYNPSGASGLWQILGQVVPGDIFDPAVNAENAVAKFRASGDTFAQWVCR